jgi:lysophospholipase L1-like esterase
MFINPKNHSIMTNKEKNMKTILCYGDSNTWGYNPLSGERHKYNERGTTILKKKLGYEYLIIPEGLNGRTTVWDDPIEGHKNGATYLSPCLESHKPIDLVIILLGTNDLKTRFSVPPGDIAAGVGVLVDISKKSGCGINGNSPEILVLIPPEVQKLTNFSEMFAGSRDKSQEFLRVFKSMAEEYEVSCLNIGEVVHFSDADGIHFEPDQLVPLGNLVSERVKLIIK